MGAVRLEVERQGGVDTGCPAEEGVGVAAVQAVEVEVDRAGCWVAARAAAASVAAARDSAHVG